PAPGPIVLQSAVDAIGMPCVNRNVIELPDRRRVQIIPVLHAVVGGIESAVAADNHVPAVARVDPQRMLVGMHAVAAIGLETLAAAAGSVPGIAEDVDVLVVAGIDTDLAEVHGARI